MKIRIYSDLHNEFNLFEVPVMEDESEQVLVLAGDIGLLSPSTIDHTMLHFIDGLAERFAHVVFVAGNHEYYKSVMQKVDKILETGMYPKNFERLGWAENVHFLQNKSIIIDDIAFIGSTLWTNFDGGSPVTMNVAKTGMNDYRSITFNQRGVYRKLDPYDTLQLHQKAKNYIFDCVDKYRDEGKKVVVISHHLPSFNSIDPMHVGSPYNGSYASNLDERIAEHKPDIWIHGHTHCSKDYEIYGTRIVCNPRGYFIRDNNGVKQPENKEFNPMKIIEV